MKPVPVDYKKKIKDLEEELVRKNELLEQLRKENMALFRVALKRGEERIVLKAEKRISPTVKQE